MVKNGSAFIETEISEKDILNIRVSDGNLYAEVIERKKSNGK